MTKHSGHTWREWHDTPYMGGWDVMDAGGEMVVTIDHIDQTEMVFSPEEGRKVAKVVIYFRETDKRLIGRPVIYKGIDSALGTEDYTLWLGQQITLTTEHGKWGGEERDAVRVKKGRPRRIAPRAAAPADLVKCGTALRDALREGGVTSQADAMRVHAWLVGQGKLTATQPLSALSDDDVAWITGAPDVVRAAMEDG